MNIQDFKRILISFADNAADVEVNKGKVTAAIRGEFIEIELIEKDSELYIKEDGIERKALTWISQRLAQLEQLADRILEYIKPIDEFITPTGRLLDDIESDPTETENQVSNICDSLQNKLSQKIPGTTSVIYLTSDAGEGKTTLINHQSILQARQFKRKQSSWLLVPIPLGGRPFLRFDDIVIASLVNRLRFRLFYYESFIELVKLGLIVPAFDGFEEMFMENSSGEALSATGQLMAKLNSSGNVLIAARQAYFDYKNFSSQAKLFDTIGSNSVAFSKISINRWDKSQFILYAMSKGINDGETIYDLVSTKLGDPKHPLLTRPVLVNRLLDVVQTTADFERISTVLESSSEYFYNFVDAIVKREAELKWIDTSGELHKPLLTVEEHHDLLSVIAEEMWLNSTDSLPIDIIDLLADMYCESKGFNVRVSRQIKERLKQHALLVKSDQVNNHLKFDHDEFMYFFLGIAFYKAMQPNRVSHFKNLMRKGSIYKQTVESIVVSLKKENVLPATIIELFNLVQNSEGPASFVKENCGALILRILSSLDCKETTLENYFFPPNCLTGIILNHLTISRSNFQASELKAITLSNCLFDTCTFEGLEIYDEHTYINNTIFRSCQVLFVTQDDEDVTIYDPQIIQEILTDTGFIIDESSTAISQKKDRKDSDPDLEIVERALRKFIRTSQINDNIFRMRLGVNAEHFLKYLLPKLIKEKIIGEVEYIGSGQKRRFKLLVPFDKINDALKAANGSLQSFLQYFRSSN